MEKSSIPAKERGKGIVAVKWLTVERDTFGWSVKQNTRGLSDVFFYFF